MEKAVFFGLLLVFFFWFVCLFLPALGSIKLGRYIPHPTQTLLCEEGANGERLLIIIKDYLLRS